MLAMEVLLEITASRESLQAFSIRETFVPEVKDVLRGFAFDRQHFRQTRRWRD